MNPVFPDNKKHIRWFFPIKNWKNSVLYVFQLNRFLEFTYENDVLTNWLTDWSNEIKSWCNYCIPYWAPLAVSTRENGGLLQIHLQFRVQLEKWWVTSILKLTSSMHPYITVCFSTTSCFPTSLSKPLYPFYCILLSNTFSFNLICFLFLCTCPLLASIPYSLAILIPVSD